MKGYSYNMFLVAKDLKWLYEMCSRPCLVVKHKICDIMNVGDYP